VITRAGTSRRQLDRTIAEARGGPAQGGRRGLRRHASITNTLFLIPAFVFVAIFSIYPMYILIEMSIARVGIADILGVWPYVGLGNFSEILSDPTFRQVAVQTVILVGGIVIVTLVAGLVAAFLLRAQTRFNAVTQTLMVLVWVLPPVIVGSLWKFLLSSDGVFNTVLLWLHVIREPIAFLADNGVALAAVAMVMLWTGLPFAALVLKAAMLDISPEILDAGQVDGASNWQIATRIVIPMIRPAVLTLAILILVGAFKTFDLIYVMTQGGPGTSTATVPYLGYVSAFRDYNFGIAAAMSVVAMIVVLIMSGIYVWALRREERS